MWFHLSHTPFRTFLLQRRTLCAHWKEVCARELVWPNFHLNIWHPVRHCSMLPHMTVVDFSQVFLILSWNKSHSWLQKELTELKVDADKSHLCMVQFSYSDSGFYSVSQSCCTVHLVSWAWCLRVSTSNSLRREERGTEVLPWFTPEIQIKTRADDLIILTSENKPQLC